MLTFHNVLSSALFGSVRGSGNLDAIQIMKMLGGAMTDSYLEEGFLLKKKVGLNQPKKMENCKGE